MSHPHEERGGRWVPHLTFWRVVFVLVMVFALYAAVIRFARGLGASTNLSDAFPWGIWIGFDVLVGVGLAAGGFVVAATVHIFRIKRYEPVARPTVLTAFLGYLLVIVGLLFDLGRPDRIWHPLIMWNPHSVMFEVGWCVMLYTTVLALEFSPLLLERLGLHKPLRILHSAFVPLVIIGVLLSTMHQSSLGTLFVIAPDKLHGLWYSPLLPVFFFISAVAGGLAMTIFESFMSRRAFGKQLERDLLEGLGRLIVVVLAVYTVWKLEDLALRGNFGLIFRVSPESVMFWGEMALGAILPMVLFATPRVRRSESGLFLASTLTVLGFIVNRLNVATTGMAASSGVLYIPSWMELAVTAAVVTLGFALFGLAVKYLPVFPEHELAGRDPVAVWASRRAGASLNRGSLAALWGLLSVGVVLLVATGVKGERPNVNPAGRPVPPADGTLRMEGVALTELDPYVFPTSEDSPGPVTFDHESHVDLNRPQCDRCHAELFSLTEPGRPLSGELSYEEIHEGRLCASCHDGEEAFAVADACEGCHQE